MRKTKRDFRMRNKDLGIFEGRLSRSKLRREYRRYDGLYRRRKVCIDQVKLALIEGMRHLRKRENMIEGVSKRNYVISAREPIGGDKSPKR